MDEVITTEELLSLLFEYWNAEKNEDRLWAIHQTNENEYHELHGVWPDEENFPSGQRYVAAADSKNHLKERFWKACAKYFQGRQDTSWLDTDTRGDVPS